jgi:tRNA(Arg) A34 adenosine deaminase TadA
MARTSPEDAMQPPAPPTPEYDEPTPTGNDASATADAPPASVPPLPASPALAHYWTAPVHALATVATPPFTEVELERHQIFTLLVMALVHRYWNGNKYGAVGDYPLRPNQRLDRTDTRPVKLYLGAERRGVPGALPSHDFDYLGHNIAAIAVDRNGNVIDFEFNHNEVLDSSVEHAESRLIRRVFSLTQLDQAWAVASPATELEQQVGREYSTMLTDVTVYTSLEPCAQCAGIMALAQVKTLVYLQTDPGMYSIGNILYNLTHLDGSRLLAPLPVSGVALGMPLAAQLERGFTAFQLGAGTQDFFQRDPGHVATKSAAITSFLCTDVAWAIFGRAVTEFRGLGARLLTLPDGTTPNVGVLERARHFYRYAVGVGERGTPHKL